MSGVLFVIEDYGHPDMFNLIDSHLPTSLPAHSQIYIPSGAEPSAHSTTNYINNVLNNNKINKNCTRGYDGLAAAHASTKGGIFEPQLELNAENFYYIEARAPVTSSASLM